MQIEESSGSSNWYSEKYVYLAGGAVFTVPACWWQKQTQLGATPGDPCESHPIITAVILHTKDWNRTDRHRAVDMISSPLGV